MKIASSLKIFKFADFSLIFQSNIKFSDFSRFSRLRSNSGRVCFSSNSSAQKSYQLMTVQQRQVLHQNHHSLCSLSCIQKKMCRSLIGESGIFVAKLFLLRGSRRRDSQHLFQFSCMEVAFNHKILFIYLFIFFLNFI